MSSMSLSVVAFLCLLWGCANKSDIALADMFDSGVKKGATTLSAPWGRTVAKITLDERGTKLPTIFTHPDSSISFALKLPGKNNIRFTSMIGIHPLAKTWGSDGVRYKIIVAEGNKSPKELFDSYIMPESALQPVDVDLSAFKGKRITCILSVSNDKGKNGRADWAIWVDPHIKSE
jgi:hypothetical protein